MNSSLNIRTIPIQNLSFIFKYLQLLDCLFISPTSNLKKEKNPYLLKTPPKSEAFKHSGGASRLCTSATVTLYFDVELSKDSLPGTEQKMSTGVVANKRPSLLLGSRALIPVRK